MHDSDVTRLEKNPKGESHTFPAIKQLGENDAIAEKDPVSFKRETGRARSRD